MSRLPTLFIPHGGGPCFFMDWDPPDTWDRMAAYLRGVPSDIGRRPDAIVLISGHWEEETVTIQSNQSPPLLFDYYGFPDSTYQLEYPAAGSPALAERISTLLDRAAIDSRRDTERGFDHGVFIPLKVAFPDADIPIVQISLRADLNPAAHIALGEALQPLRDEGVLILGSGMTYHNMQTLMGNMRGGDRPAPDSETFDGWLTDVLTARQPEARNKALMDWESAPAARMAHPREEHLLPLHVVAGAAGPDEGRRTLKDTVLGAVESAFQFG
jgi:aromatic ring-opening dioxygenase catalytic subunit (LigB family)